MLRSALSRGRKASASFRNSPGLRTSSSSTEFLQLLSSHLLPVQPPVHGLHKALLQSRKGWAVGQRGRAYSGSKVVSKGGGVKVETAAGVLPRVPSVRTGLRSWYMGMLHKHPLLTKSLTASTIYTTADAASQAISKFHSHSSDGEGSSQWDLHRISRMAAFGFFLSGPSLHFWFNFLSRILPKRDIISTFKKMLMGQILYGPTFTTIFFSLNAFAQGETGVEVFQRLKRDLLPTFKSGLMYWPVCDLITFRYVPVHLQPLVSNSFSFIWTVYLTYMASLKKVSNNPNMASPKKIVGSPNLENT
ncbi:hypothetical protein O6H91_04G124100 [Diphasiastrum complanatum]|uniref:Uncharacterized protein n=1 Tax=Diphasiastrum complanatum TaxID=34168 RepID=A0ACC2E1P5_DIPCM|nr:hypothetical protein O6H91_04G124100 [Diphasiastrum complanatum]